MAFEITPGQKVLVVGEFITRGMLGLDIVRLPVAGADPRDVEVMRLRGEAPSLLPLDELRGVLRMVEWHQPRSNARPSCPCCGGFRTAENVHEGGCQLVALLSRLGEE